MRLERSILIMLAVCMAGCASLPVELPPTPLVAAALITPWSEPVNGLSIRIEQASPELHWTRSIFVRLRNAGNRPMIVPTAGIGGAGSPFRVAVESNGVWSAMGPDDRPPALETQELAPGDEALCELNLSVSR